MERTVQQSIFQVLRVLAIADEINQVFELGDYAVVPKLFFISPLFIMGAASTHRDQKKNFVSSIPVIPSSPTAQALDLGGDLVGGKVANTVELGAGVTFTTYSFVDACGKCAFKCYRQLSMVMVMVNEVR